MSQMSIPRHLDPLGVRALGRTGLCPRLRVMGTKQEEYHQMAFVRGRSEVEGIHTTISLYATPSWAATLYRRTYLVPAQPLFTNRSHAVNLL
jgi:hypothetical protein